MRKQTAWFCFADSANEKEIAIQKCLPTIIVFRFCNDNELQMNKMKKYLSRFEV